MRVLTAGSVAGCAAAASVALGLGGLALAYVDRDLVPARLTTWASSSISRSPNRKTDEGASPFARRRIARTLATTSSRLNGFVT